jgi:hypothetical protein
MRHARNRSTVGRHIAVVISLGTVLTAVAACGGAAAAPATRAPATAEAATPPLEALAPTAPAAVTPSAVPRQFESPVYGYTIDLPDGSGITSVIPATTRWGGAREIGSTDPFVDQFQRSGQRLAFILSAPTDLDLDAWAADVHARAVRDHGCSEELTDTRDVEIDGTPARVVAFACQGLRVYEATTVRDGTGFIAKQLTPRPGSPDLEKASLDDFIWFLESLSLAK